MRSSTSFQPLVPSAIVAPAPEDTYKAALPQLVKQRFDFASSQDYIHYITHKVNNVRHLNGRIYLKIENGVLIANSLSPYADSFLENIEEKILPLVKALRDKRYLTYSSCMGHDYTYRRYVGLAFADEQSRDYVAQKIASLNLLGVKTKKLSTVANNQVEQSSETGAPVVSKAKTVEQATISKMCDKSKEENNYQQECAVFNIQFHRSYERYYFLEIIIYDALSFKYEGIIAQIKKIFWRCMKRWMWDKTTQKVVNLINSPDFKKYGY